MFILPSELINERYDEISDWCKFTGELVYLTKNGEPDLVVLSLEAYEKQQTLAALKEKLQNIELEQRNGARYYSLDQLDSALRESLETPIHTIDLF